MNEKEIFEELLGELKDITNNVSAKAQETSKKIGEFTKLTERVDELESRIAKLEEIIGNEEVTKEACKCAENETDIKVEDLNNDKSLDKNPSYNIFISQPMTGFSVEGIKFTRDIVKARISRHFKMKHFGKEVDVNFIDNLQEDLPADTHPLEYLGNDIKMLKDADYVFFCKGWEKSRGCNIEFQVAKFYDIPMFLCKIFPGSSLNLGFLFFAKLSRKIMI